MIPEPVGGAHRDPIVAAAALKRCITENLEILGKTPIRELLDRRLEKYTNMGTYEE
jgi:acetyl-CoA carboxylase carboxyl transferase subunit alpha